MLFEIKKQKKRTHKCSWLKASTASVLIAFFLTACSDFFEPVDSTPTPTEYSYNYWLLQRTYLFEDELPQLDENGDSVQELYSKLSDPYTRYVPPAKSEEAIIHNNSSLIIGGDIGLEYSFFPQMEHPLVISRVYPKAPAGRAGVPQKGTILNVNGIEIDGENAVSKYDSVLSYSKEISMTVAYKGDTLHFDLVKENVYAPTVFVDTFKVGSKHIHVITIRQFRQNTADLEKGTAGELRTYLEESKGYTEPAILDLRNNPGGQVSQCTDAADQFIEEGLITTQFERTYAVDGKPTYIKAPTTAKPGDPGEKRKFVVLVNKGSASCAEIFTSAISEGANIPVAGDTTYGKGIGQNTKKTMAGGLAYITSLEFVTPKGNSYHKKGIAPDYPCSKPVTLQCGFDAIEKFYGTKSPKKVTSKDRDDGIVILPSKSTYGGALVQEENRPNLVY